MVENNNKTIILAIASMLAVGGTLTYFPSALTKAMHKNQFPTATVYMSGEVNPKTVSSTVDAIRDLVELGADHVLLELNSPGGSVVDGKQLQYTMRDLKNVDVYIPGGMAASMAAEILMVAKNRFVEVDSEIMFHGASIGGLRQPDMAVVVRILNGEEVKQDNPDINYNKAIAFSAMMIIEMGRPAALKMANKLLSELTEINEAGVVNTHKALVDAGVEMTVDQVREKFYGNFFKDTYFTGQELVDMGLATAGRPSSKNYQY